MTAQPHSKHFASLSIEQEPEPQPHQQQQNWLLTYVDVFILIIMLVITLIALSDFEAEIKQKKTKKLASKQVKTITPSLPQPSPEKIAKIKQETVVTPAVKPTEPLQIQTEEKTITEQQPAEIIQPKEQPVVEPDPVIAEAPTETDAQLKKDDLQKKLNTTLSELGLVDAVNMKVTLGYAQLEIQDKILFKSSDAALVNSGEDLLKKLTALLKQSTGLIYIEGHTDDRPIKTAKFPSNWELGAARATSVLHFLATQGLDMTRLRAITYGSTKPIADNVSKEGREKNRRVSLVIKVADEID